jgi:hypothetical protein
LLEQQVGLLELQAVWRQLQVPLEHWHLVEFPPRLDIQNTLYVEEFYRH